MFSHNGLRHLREPILKIGIGGADDSNFGLAPSDCGGRVDLPDDTDQWVFRRPVSI
jgi:hypothetical protein